MLFGTIRHLIKGIIRINNIIFCAIRVLKRGLLNGTFNINLRLMYSRY